MGKGRKRYVFSECSLVNKHNKFKLDNAYLKVEPIAITTSYLSPEIIIKACTMSCCSQMLHEKRTMICKYQYPTMINYDGDFETYAEYAPSNHF
jgi:hypothetical protein